MLRIIISGILGRMGQNIIYIADEESLIIAAGFDIIENTEAGVPIFNNIEKLPTDVQCVVDFSSPGGFEKIVKFCGDKKIPLVSGTTGLDDAQKELLKGLSETVPVFYSANMSIAVGFIGMISSDAAKLFADSDVEIIEMHHRDKADAPSGTALTIAEKIVSARGWEEDAIIFGRHGKTGTRPEKQLAIHAIRGGGAVGEHKVIFAMPDEEIILIHRARDRKLFARGAIEAMKWLAKKQPGLYSIGDLLTSI